MTTETKTYANPLDVLESMPEEKFNGSVYGDPLTGERCAIGELSLQALMIRDGLSFEDAIYEIERNMPFGLYDLCETRYGLNMEELERIDRMAQDYPRDLDPVIKYVQRIVRKNGRWHGDL